MTRIALALLIASSLLACSKKDAERSRNTESVEPPEGSIAALETVERAVRVFSRERPTVDLVAAELRGTIRERTPARAFMDYKGYRVALMTPGEVVTRIDFQFDDTRPSIGQLQDLFGKPEELRDRVLFTYEKASINQTINIIANPVSMPVEGATLVKGLRIEGARKGR